MNQYCVMLRINESEWSTIAACDTLKAAKAFIGRHAKSNKGNLDVKEYQVVIAFVQTEISMSVLYTRFYP